MRHGELPVVRLRANQQEEKQEKPMSKVSPIHIDIAIHYRMKSGDFPYLGSTVAIQAIEDLFRRGLLERTTLSESGRSYQPTEGLGLWIDWLCETPFPVHRWSRPDQEVVGPEPPFKPSSHFDWDANPGTMVDPTGSPVPRRP